MSLLARAHSRAAGDNAHAEALSVRSLQQLQRVLPAAGLLARADHRAAADPVRGQAGDGDLGQQLHGGAPARRLLARRDRHAPPDKARRQAGGLHLRQERQAFPPLATPSAGLHHSAVAGHIHAQRPCTHGVDKPHCGLPSGALGAGIGSDGVVHRVWRRPPGAHDPEETEDLLPPAARGGREECGVVAARALPTLRGLR
mmetsp:Transcript_49622/g.99954  ORF Transcript_49622/g.99954 Transcript_49622/m.99954 type:complete len:200 (-) Transcript_49622:78-677(-)